MSDKSWKAFERRLGKRHGGKRIPVTGERDGADVVAVSGPFVIQAKLGRRFPSYLRAWLDGIRAAGQRAGGKTGIVVWKPKGVRDDNAMVLLSLKDWTELHGELSYTTASRDDDPPY